MALDACATMIARGDSHPAAWQAGWASCAETIASLIMDKRDQPQPKVKLDFNGNPVEVRHG